MADLIRDAPIGQIIRWVTRNRVLLYPEERPDFQCPSTYKNPDGSEVDSEKTVRKDDPSLSNFDTVLEDRSQHGSQDTIAGDREIEQHDGYDLGKDKSAKDLEIDGTEGADMEKIQTARDDRDLDDMQPTKSTKTNRTTKSARSAGSIERIPTQSALAQAETRQDLEQQLSNSSMPRQPTQPIIPEKLEDGTILVDWYDTDDPSNPQNWSLKKKLFTLILIW